MSKRFKIIPKFLIMAVFFMFVSSSVKRSSEVQLSGSSRGEKSKMVRLGEKTHFVESLCSGSEVGSLGTTKKTSGAYSVISQKARESSFLHDKRARLDARGFSPQFITTGIKKAAQQRGIFGLIGVLCQHRYVLNEIHIGVFFNSLLLPTIIKDKGKEKFNSFVCDLESLLILKLRERSGEFQAQGLINILGAYNTLKITNEEVFFLIKNEIKNRGRSGRIREFNNLDITGLLDYCIELKILDEEILIEINREIDERLRDGRISGFNEESIFRIFKTYAGLEIKDRIIFDGIVKEIQKDERLSSFKVIHLSLILRVCEKSKIEDPEFFSLIAREIEKRISILRGEGFCAKDLSMILKSFANLKITDKGPIALIIGEIRKRVAALRGWEFDEKDLTDILIACLDLNVKDITILGFLAKEIKERAEKFSPLQLTESFRVYSQFGIKDRLVVDAVSLELVRRARDGTIQDFSLLDLGTTLYSYADLGIKKQEVFTLIAREIERRGSVGLLGNVNLKISFRILQAYVRLDIKDLAVLNIIGRSIEYSERTGEITHIEPKNLAFILCDYAKIGVIDEKVFEVIERELTRRISENLIRDFPLLVLAKIVWAYAVIGALSPLQKSDKHKSLVESLFSVIAPKIEGFEDEGIFTQIAQSAAYFQFDDFWKPFDIESLRFRSDIESVLEHEVGMWLTEELGYKKGVNLEQKSAFRCVDFFNKKSLTVVEIDGPSHYDSEGRETVSTIFRNKILERNGVKLVVIGFKEWEACKGGEARMAYLEEKKLLA